MTRIYDIAQLVEPLSNPVLTIGNFDGVHKGHLALFDEVKARARILDGVPAVMTFDPHPLKVMRPGNGPSQITPTRQKLELIEKAGIDFIFCLPFTPDFAAITAQDFVDRILVGAIGIRELVVGYDYAFGRNRQGDTDFLRAAGKRSGFAVHVLEPFFVEGTLVSSTTIRNLVKEGLLDAARKLLGRDYQITGTVVRGRGRGATVLGFPTANLQPMDELIPRRGVYAVSVLIGRRLHQGVTNIGYNPTFGGGPFSIETHVLDFNEGLVGETIRINFLARLRDERPFNNAEELARQIRKDVAEARAFFAKFPQRLT